MCCSRRYWFHTSGQTSYQKPAFGTFREHVGARAVQSAVRGHLGRARFRRIRDRAAAAVLGIDLEDGLVVETLSLTRALIAKGQEAVYVGFQEEGVTAEQWMHRIGLSHVAAEFCERARKAALAAGGAGGAVSSVAEPAAGQARPAPAVGDGAVSAGPGRTRPRRTKGSKKDADDPATVLAMPLAKFKALGERGWKRVGVLDSADREVMSAYCEGVGSAVDGADLLWDREEAVGVYLKSFRGQEVRATAFSKTVVSLLHPPSITAMEAYFKKYSGKAREAQEHVVDDLGLLVTVPARQDVVRMLTLFLSGAAHVAALAREGGMPRVADGVARVVERARELAAHAYPEWPSRALRGITPEEAAARKRAEEEQKLAGKRFVGGGGGGGGGAGSGAGAAAGAPTDARADAVAARAARIVVYSNKGMRLRRARERKLVLIERGIIRDEEKIAREKAAAEAAYAASIAKLRDPDDPTVPLIVHGRDLRRVEADATLAVRTILDGVMKLNEASTRLAAQWHGIKMRRYYEDLLARREKCTRIWQRLYRGHCGRREAQGVSVGRCAGPGLGVRVTGARRCATSRTLSGSSAGTRRRMRSTSSTRRRARRAGRSPMRRTVRLGGGRRRSRCPRCCGL